MPQIDALPAMTESPAPDDVLPLHNESSGDTEKVRVDDLVGSPALGWIADSNTWTYVSGTGTITGVFKMTGVDATGYLEAGMRIKLTQTQVKYGIITKVAFSTDTTVTCLMAATAGVVDNSGITNTTISSPAFSRAKIPFAFPLDPAKWTVTVSNSSDCTKTSAVANTWYGDTGLSPTGPSILLPIGVWNIVVKAQIATSNTGVSCAVQASFSSSSSSESDSDYRIEYTLASTNLNGHFPYNISKNMTISTPTTYYLIIRSISSSTTIVQFAGSNDSSSIVRAISAYL